MKNVTLDRTKEWIRNNPLRRWLDRQQRGALRDLYVGLAVSRDTVQRWMRGERSMNLGHFMELARRTGITLDDWHRWEQGRPQ